MQSLFDLVLPRECGGCGIGGTSWCERCQFALASEPTALFPRVPVGVPCWTMGIYAGPRRRSVVAAKERGRRDLAVPLGCALADALQFLRNAGEIDPWQLSSLTLVPAPTRRRAARSRGGDPVLRMCRAAVHHLEPERAVVAPVAVLGRGVRDSVGLNAKARAVNLSGRVHVRGGAPCEGTVVVVDDVLTTGTTASETVRALRLSGVKVDAVLVVASVP